MVYWIGWITLVLFSSGVLLIGASLFAVRMGEIYERRLARLRKEIWIEISRDMIDDSWYFSESPEAMHALAFYAEGIWKSGGHANLQKVRDEWRRKIESEKPKATEEIHGL